MFGLKNVNFTLTEFLNFKLFGNTILVVNIKFGLLWAFHSASENPSAHAFGAGCDWAMKAEKRPLGCERFAGSFCPTPRQASGVWHHMPNQKKQKAPALFLPLIPFCPECSICVFPSFNPADPFVCGPNGLPTIRAGIPNLSFMFGSPSSAIHLFTFGGALSIFVSRVFRSVSFATCVCHLPTF